MMQSVVCKALICCSPSTGLFQRERKVRRISGKGGLVWGTENFRREKRYFPCLLLLVGSGAQ